MRAFSSTVAFGRMLVIWYERAIPRWEIRSGDRPVMSSPARKIAPDAGRRTPVRQLKNVLLPAPLGPMMARTCPSGTEKSTAVRADRPPNRIVSFSVRSSGRARAGAAVAPRLDLARPDFAGIGSAVTLGREPAGRRYDGLFLRHHVLDRVGAALHLVDE